MTDVSGPWAAHILDGPAASEVDRLWTVGPVWREIRLAPMPSAARGDHWVIVGGSGIPDDGVPPWPGEVSYLLVEVVDGIHPVVDVEVVAFYRLATGRAWTRAGKVWPRRDVGGLLPHLGRTAREARREAGCTLAQVAAELGVHESTPSRFENGVAWPASPDATINAYSRVTGVSVADLWLHAIEAWDEAVADAAR